MDHSKLPYRDFVTFRSQPNPYILGLTEYLGRELGGPSPFTLLSYPRNEGSPEEPLGVAKADVTKLLGVTSTFHGRVLFVENIQPDLVSLFGEISDVDPVFFAGHIITNFEDTEKAPPPPSLAMFPSRFAEREYLHINNQKVIGLGSVDTIRSAYAFRTDSSIPRNVRRLPHLSGRQLALARACCSVLVKRFKTSWICLVLTDPPINSVIETLHSGNRKTYRNFPPQKGFEDFEQQVSFSSFKSTAIHHQWNTNSMLNSLLHYFRNQPPGLTIAPPSILSLCYFPIRIVLAEWIVYTSLMSRYLKHYEYSLRDVQNRLHDNDIIDLQRWRRRSKQSQHKIILLTEFVDYWLQKEGDKQSWNIVLKDIRHVRSQLGDYSHSLEQMLPVATSMVQLLDFRRSMLDAANLKRLTHIALVFVPLSWVASLFSMSDSYSPGHAYFWVYFATALPVLFMVLFLSGLHHNQPQETLKRALEMFKCPASRRRKPEEESL